MYINLKPGDIVKVINADGYGSGLKLGSFCCVRSTDGNFCSVDGPTGEVYPEQYLQERFKVVRGSFREGDRVRLMNNVVSAWSMARGWTSSMILEVGQEYTVGCVTFEGHLKFGANHTEYNPDCFELVDESADRKESKPEVYVYEKVHVYQINKEEKTMEIAQIKKQNLKEAKKQFDQERMNQEVEYAKNQLRSATDNINALDRQIADLVERKKPYLEILARF